MNILKQVAILKFLRVSTNSTGESKLMSALDLFEIKKNKLQKPGPASYSTTTTEPLAFHLKRVNSVLFDVHMSSYKSVELNRFIATIRCFCVSEGYYFLRDHN